MRHLHLLSRLLIEACGHLALHPLLLSAHLSVAFEREEHTVLTIGNFNIIMKVAFFIPVVHLSCLERTLLVAMSIFVVPLVLLGSS